MEKAARCSIYKQLVDLHGKNRCVAVWRSLRTEFSTKIRQKIYRAKTFFLTERKQIYSLKFSVTFWIAQTDYYYYFQYMDHLQVAAFRFHPQGEERNFSVFLRNCMQWDGKKLQVQKSRWKNNQKMWSFWELKLDLDISLTSPTN